VPKRNHRLLLEELVNLKPTFNYSKDQWVATEANLKAFIKRLEADLAAVRSKVDTASAEANNKLQEALGKLDQACSEKQKMQVLIDESQVSLNFTCQ
jgi:uncharacterized protein YdaU (DUF1376 family)